VKHLKELFIMIIPMFVDLQGFIVNKKFIVKEVVETEDRSHITFMSPVEICDKIRQVALPG